MPGFKVLKAAVWSNIKDLGRVGYAHLGIKNAGAMDEYAYRWSQKLLENRDANAIEVLLGGLVLQATSSVTICVTGADLDFRINHKRKKSWQTHQVKKGDIIGFYAQQSGQRAYLAVKGGFIAEKRRSSYAKEYYEKPLQKGDFLAFSSSYSNETRRLSPKLIPHYGNQLTLHILLTSQASRFSKESKNLFFHTHYTLTPDISPMGYKLQGVALESDHPGIISEGIPFGAVQVPPDGQPIILLKERQTIGGYPKLGTILATDCFKLTQLPIGSRVTFKEIGLENAQKEMKKFYTLFETL